MSEDKTTIPAPETSNDDATKLASDMSALCDMIAAINDFETRNNARKE